MLWNENTKINTLIFVRGTDFLSNWIQVKTEVALTTNEKIKKGKMTKNGKLNNVFQFR